MIKEPTREQQKVINHNSNAVVTAKPGSGKTYTIVEKIAKITPGLQDYQGVIAISFTNKASDELRRRCKERGITPKQSFFGTIDKFYISQIIIPFASHLTYSTSEYQIIDVIKDNPRYSMFSNLSEKSSSEQEKLLLSALAEGIIFLEFSGETALLILKRVPCAMRYIKSRYTHIFIDEYQDCGQIQHAIFLTLIENGLTGIAVGDINQAIYAFSNRFPDYLISLIGHKNFQHFELTQNHRCHPSISDYSLGLFGVSKMPVDEKRVFQVNIAGNEIDIARKIDKYLPEIKDRYKITCNNQTAILCRGGNTIQLLDNALATPHKTFTDTPLDHDNSEWGRFFCGLLTAVFDPSIFAVDYVEGIISEDLNPKKYRLALELCNDIFASTKNTIVKAVPKMIKLANIIYPQKETRNVIDLLKQVVCDVSLLSSYIPAAEDEINLMTLHKSKGLEFNIVFHMDLYKWIIPNEYGDADAQKQDLNLHYVGVTRAMDACYFMNGTMRYRKKNGDFVRSEPSPFLFKPGLAEKRRNVSWN